VPHASVFEARVLAFPINITTEGDSPRIPPNSSSRFAAVLAGQFAGLDGFMARRVNDFVHPVDAFSPPTVGVVKRPSSKARHDWSTLTFWIIRAINYCLPQNVFAWNEFSGPVPVLFEKLLVLIWCSHLIPPAFS
jgi:hypothetical protein